MKRLLFAISFAIILAPALFAQQFTPSVPAQQGIKTPVKWQVMANAADGDTIMLQISASIDSLWKVYAPHIATELPLPLIITLENGAAQDIVELTPAIEKYDELFEEDVRYFTKEFALKVPVALTAGGRVSGSIEYKACNMITFACVSPTYDFDVAIESQAPRAAQGSESLWLFFLLAMLAGLAGVLTPCVFPMLPMTVSFFMRQAKPRAARRQLFVFAASVVAIYTAIGAIAALTKSATFATALSAHWLPNFIFFALFIAFAASFLGAFELTLPQKWTNKADHYADRGGYAGAFFVALTLCIVSFSCTAPFVGALLVAAADGDVVKPLAGMLGFGVAFALPFTLLGIFPAALKNLPKSGGWMSVVKVTFAFLLIMAAVKFLAAADSDLGLMLLSRELAVSIWVVCLVLWGLYMMGRLPLLHDEKSEIGAGRVFAAIAAFAAALYLSTALLGAKMPLLEGLLPEHSTLPSANVSIKAAPVPALCGAALYADNSSLTAPVAGAYFDLKQAQQCAKEQQRPLLLYFKGHSCANCKKMQKTLLADERVVDLLQNKYVVAALYTDDKTPLPQAEWYVSAFDGKTKKTLGQHNLDYLMTTYKVNSIPYFVIEEDGENTAAIGYTSDLEEFLDFIGKQ